MRPWPRIADALERRSAEVLDANAADVAGASGQTAAIIDRLALDPDRLAAIAARRAHDRRPARPDRRRPARLHARERDPGAEAARSAGGRDGGVRGSPERRRRRRRALHQVRQRVHPARVAARGAHEPRARRHRARLARGGRHPGRRGRRRRRRARGARRAPRRPGDGRCRHPPRRRGAEEAAPARLADPGAGGGRRELPRLRRRLRRCRRRGRDRRQCEDAAPGGVQRGRDVARASRPAGAPRRDLRRAP